MWGSGSIHQSKVVSISLSDFNFSYAPLVWITPYNSGQGHWIGALTVSKSEISFRVFRPDTFGSAKVNYCILMLY